MRATPGLRFITAVSFAAALPVAGAHAGVPPPDGSAGPPPAPSGGPRVLETDLLKPFRNYVVEGGVVAGATCISDNGLAAGGPDGGVIQITGIPPGATVLEAWMWWVVEDLWLPVGAGGTPALNGIPIAPVPLGTMERTPCFSQRYTGSFRADVSCVVQGNGSYRLTGFPTNPNSNRGYPFTDGATIAVIYCQPGAPRTRIVIYDGLDVTNTWYPDHSQTIQGFGPVQAPVRASLLAVVGNGQISPPGSQDPDNFYFNGTPFESLFPSLEVLSGSACPAKRSESWWDLGLFDVSSLLAAGTTSATFTTHWDQAAPDCYSFIAYLLAVNDAQGPRACLPCQASIQPDARCVPAGWCLGDRIPLCTAGFTTSQGCSSGILEYQWWKDAVGSGTVVRPWGTDPTYVPGGEARPGPNTYAVEVRCRGQCCPLESASTVVDLWLTPLAEAGLEPEVCVNSPTVLGGSPTASAGTPPYRYSWTPAAELVNPTASNPTTVPMVSATTFQVTVTDANGCVATDQVSVTPLPYPIAEAGPDVETCQGTLVTLDGSASQGPGCASFLQYRWLEGAREVRGWLASPTYLVAPAADTLYTLEVRCLAATDCVSSDQVLVQVHPLAVAEAGPDLAVCAGAPVQLDGSASGGCAPGGASYRWLAGATEVCPWSSSAVCLVSPGAPTLYTLEVACGGFTSCARRDTVWVNVVPPAVAAAGPDRSVCAGASVVLDGSGSSGCGASGTSYRWLLGAQEVCPWSPSPTCRVSPGASGTYTLEVACGGVAACAARDEVDVTVTPVPVARAGADHGVCPGGAARLDGSGSSGCGAGATGYRWLDGASEVCGWSANPVCLVSPAGTTLYTLEVACGAGLACSASDSVSVVVEPLPVAEAGPDLAGCTGSPLRLDGSGSTDPGCPGGLRYEWREGAAVLRPWSAAPDWAPPTLLPGARGYALAVRCAVGSGCETTDDVQVTLRPCPLRADFVDLEARRLDGSPAVEVSFRTLLEEDSNLFRIERAAAPSGPFEPLEPALEARGSGSSYRFVDAGAKLDRAWYRVVEYTSNGRGSVSAVLEATAPPARSGGRGSGRRQRR